MKTITEKIKWQERVHYYRTSSSGYDSVTLEHEAIVVIRENGEVTVIKHTDAKEATPTGGDSKNV